MKTRLSHSARLRPLLLFLLLPLGLGLAVTPTMAAPRAIRAAYSALSGTQAPFWMAQEAGLFARYGLKADLIYLSGIGDKALLAGEVQFASPTAGKVVAGQVAGADMAVVAVHINTIPSSIVVRPEITKPEDLRGKTLGVSMFGTLSDTGTRMALLKWGLAPQRDVILRQMGAMPQTATAMEAGLIHGGFMSPPLSLRLRDRGLRILGDLPAMGIHYPGSILITTGTLAKKDRAMVLAFLKAFVHGIARFKRDPELAMTVMGKYTRVTEPKLLAETYKIFTGVIERAPYPDMQGLKAMVEFESQANPQLLRAKLEEVVDTSFVRELEQSGFIEALYR
ncbi:MAG: ABC transporter substrate-binding protein [Deltaproteobacteria bacterium]|nr:ABC transporter substrate-binding protein [Deltaproteobacteria bacterium]MBI3079307.1 ABC transporter substrate-binding protein [Deltaproteobacteria bacterium]